VLLLLFSALAVAAVAVAVGCCCGCWRGSWLFVSSYLAINVLWRRSCLVIVLSVFESTFGVRLQSVQSSSLSSCSTYSTVAPVLIDAQGTKLIAVLCRLVLPTAW
jgi:hypothetical protein